LLLNIRTYTHARAHTHTHIWGGSVQSTIKGGKLRGVRENPVDMKRDVSERAKGQALMKRNI